MFIYYIYKIKYKNKNRYFYENRFVINMLKVRVKRESNPIFQICSPNAVPFCSIPYKGKYWKMAF